MKMNFFLLSILMSLSLPTASYAAAGGAGWGASGGELLGDTLNPWWVTNTINVNYCVQIDEKGVSASAEKINSFIDRGITLWKSEFNRKLNFLDNANDVMPYFNKYGVGTQNFTRINCNGSEDLKFQIGYGTLTPEQRKRIGDPKKYVGVAVRTSYDEVTMKGKGFILIGSDQGAEKFQSDLGVADRVWSNDLVLYVVLIHELGHVFGVPHVGQEFSVMSQQGPEFYVTPYVSGLLKNISYDFSAMGYFFAPETHSDSCRNVSAPANIPKTMSDFFEFPVDAKCFYFDLDENSKVITVSTSPVEGGVKTVVGAISGSSFTGTLNAAVTIKAGPKQKVLPIDPKNPFPFLIGPSFVDIDATGGIYRSSAGNEKPIHIRDSAVNPLLIFGGVNGKIVQIY